MSKVDAWKALREETLQNLDIRAKYEEFGVKFTGKVSSKNWAECYAFGRDDKSASAGVNLTTGLYKDFTGETHSIFDFMGQFGMAESWQDAQEKLAKSVGLAKKIPKKAKAKRVEDSLGFTNKVNVASIVPLARQYGINPQAILMTGVRLARYPANSSEPQIVCAFPIYDAVAMLEEQVQSYVAQDPTGRPIGVYQGPDLPPKPEKRIVIGTTGILNKWALEHWEKAERIYKVEGLSDMLVLQNFIPEEFREKHLVITNACGADDSTPAWGLANHCVGKEIVIIHDADIPGQYGTAKDQSGGAQRWIKALKGAAKSLKNVQLPYEVASKHGKDLRNWINEPGRKYADLLELVVATKDEVTGALIDGTGAVTERTPTQVILDRLGIAVLGHMADRGQTIVIFNFEMKRRFYIPDIDKFTYNKALISIGELAKSELDPSPEPSPAKIGMKDLRESIAYEACGRRVSRESAIGVGIWEINNKLVFVGCGEWMAMNGDLKSYQSPEIDDKLVDFGEGKDSWYNEEDIRKWLPYATDAAWRTEFLKELSGVFELWDNWGVTKEENHLRSFLVSSLVMSTWVQGIWSWRPWIAIIGETNSGKSTFFQFLGKFFGPQIAMVVGSGSEAGLRQSLGTASKILLLDEFEASKERTKILDWLKNSGGGGSSVRGTPGQHAIKGAVQVIPWFGATEAGMRNETERNRYVLLNLASRKGKPRFTLPDQQQIDTLRAKSLAILMRCWVRAKELHLHLNTNCQFDSLYSRYTENYSMPIAMWAAIDGLSNEESEELFQKVIGPMLEAVSFSSESEHGTLLQEVLFSRVPIGRGETRTVSELLTYQSHEVPGAEAPDKILARVGLRKMDGAEFKCGMYSPGKRFLFVAHKIVQRELLRNTDFGEKGLDQLLERIPNSFRTKQRLGGSSTRGIAIPMEDVIPFESVLNSAPVDNFVPQEHQVRSVSSDIFSEG